MCFVSISAAQHTNTNCTSSILAVIWVHPVCCLLSFPISGCLCFQWLVSEKGSEMSSLNKAFGSWRNPALRKRDQTVAVVGWALSAPREQGRCGKVTSLTRLAAPLLCLTICVAAQPNPIRFSSFPILLFMRWHFYPPIKTFKGPLSKRKECCFNSVVAPCLGPFFSVCNQPTLASRLMFSSQRRAKRGPSPLWDVWQQLSTAFFSLPQALRADYKPLACLLLLQPHCFSLSTTWFSGLKELAALWWRTCGLLGSFVRGSQESAS